jgi:hypothetical protein
MKMMSDIEFKVSMVLLMMLRDGEIDNSSYCKISRFFYSEMEPFVINEMNGFVYKKKRERKVFRKLIFWFLLY